MTIYADETEPELVSLAQRGDVEAFGEIYRRTRDEVLRAVCGRQVRIGGRTSQAVAEDVVADTYVRALARIARYEDQGKPIVAWLHTIAANLLSDHHKKMASRRELTWSQLVGDGGIWFDRPSDAPPPEQVVEQRDRFDRAVPVILGLSAQQREALLRRYYMGDSIEQAAQDMGLNPASLKTTCYRATQTARRRIEQAGVV